MNYRKANQQTEQNPLKLFFVYLFIYLFHVD